MTLLETTSLTKSFGGVTAVDRVSLRFEASAVTSIIGPNGSGKTTFVNLISGVLPIDSGTILVGGVQMRRINPHEVATYGLTRTFQEVRLIEQLPVLDNILLVLTERNVWSALFERHSELHLKRAEAVLRQVGLWDKRTALGGELSYGQRKLLEIARVLAMAAKVVLLDEPFAGLFPEVVRHVVRLIQQLRAQGAAIVLIEHNMELVRELSDYLYVLDSGKLLAEGKPAEVLSRREVIEAYLWT